MRNEAYVDGGTYDESNSGLNIGVCLLHFLDMLANKQLRSGHFQIFGTSRWFDSEQGSSENRLKSGEFVGKGGNVNWRLRFFGKSFCTTSVASSSLNMRSEVNL